MEKEIPELFKKAVEYYMDGCSGEVTDWKLDETGKVLSITICKTIESDDLDYSDFSFDSDWDDEGHYYQQITFNAAEYYLEDFEEEVRDVTSDGDPEKVDGKNFKAEVIDSSVDDNVEIDSYEHSDGGFDEPPYEDLQWSGDLDLYVYVDITYIDEAIK